MSTDKKYQFGPYIKACRLGYRWSDWNGGFLRISPLNDNMFRIDLAPGSGVPNDRRRDPALHYCWWDNGDRGAEIASHVPTLKMIRRVKSPISFVVDDEGRHLRREAVA